MPDAGDFLLAGQVSTSPGTVATGFTLSSAVARTTLGGDLVFLWLALTSNNAITATSGNLPDTTCYTLSSDFRPAENLEAIFNRQNTSGGNVSIRADGLCILRSAWASIGAGDLISFNVCFLRA